MACMSRCSPTVSVGSSTSSCGKNATWRVGVWRREVGERQLTARQQRACHAPHVCPQTGVCNLTQPRYGSTAPAVASSCSLAQQQGASHRATAPGSQRRAVQEHIALADSARAEIL